MRALLLCSWLTLALLAATARAQEGSEGADAGAVDREAGPLRDRIRPVSGHLFLKAGRLEISPSASATVRDAFFTKVAFGGSLTYHFTESFAFGLRGAYALSLVAGTAQICTEEPGTNVRSCRSPTYAELDGVAPGQITLLGGADLQWAPLYGKLSVLAEQFLHFDIYGIAGGAVVAYRGPAETAGGPARSLIAPGLNAGAGMRFFLNRWIVVRGELRDLVYAETIGKDGAGQPIHSLRNQLIFELGVSFFIPPTFGET